MKNYIISLADFLGTLMKAKNITTEKLSELSGISVRTINNLRNGTVKDPNLSTIVALCDAVNCSIDEALDRDCCGIDETLMRKYHTLPARDKKIAELILSDEDTEV